MVGQCLRAVAENVDGPNVWHEIQNKENWILFFDSGVFAKNFQELVQSIEYKPQLDEPRLVKRKESFVNIIIKFDCRRLKCWVNPSDL